MIVTHCRTLDCPVTVTSATQAFGEETISINIGNTYNLYLNRQEAYSLLSGLENLLNKAV